MRIFKLLVFIVSVLVVEAFISSFFAIVLFTQFDSFKSISTINSPLLAFGIYFLGITLYKLMFELWLIYSIAIIKTWKKGFISNNILISSRINASLIAVLIIVLIVIFEHSGLKILWKAVWFSFLYAIPIVITYFIFKKYDLANKYNDKNT